MALIQTPTQPFKVDVDEFILRDAIDANLSDFLKFVVTDAAGYVTMQAKAGDIRFADVDDADASDILQMTCDDADGGMLQKTSQITDGNIWEIRATGTISGAVATATIDYLHLDLDALVLNDAATSAITLQGIDVDFNGLTATAVTLSSITGMKIDMPNTGAFTSETGLDITIDKSAVANGAVGLAISRDITGDLAADAALSNFMGVMSQVSTNDTTGDFDLTDAAASGLLKLQMSQSDLTSAAKTDEDLMRGTALLIDIDAVTNHAQAKLDMSARAIDITYTLTETLGQLRMAATDVFRITPTIPNGLSSAGAFQFDVMELNLDNVVLNDANLTLNGIYIDASGATNTSSAEFNLISLIKPTDSDMDNVIKILADSAEASNSTTGLLISKDLANTAAGAGISQTNNALSVTSTNMNTEAQIMTISNILTDISKTNIATAAGADVYAGTVLNIGYAATTDGTGTATSSETGLLINYDLTESAGTLTLNSFNVMSIDYDTVGNADFATGTYTMLNIDANDGGTPTFAANCNFYGINCDIGSILNSDADLTIIGGYFTIPTAVGIAIERQAIKTSDGAHAANLSDGSMGISAQGINEEKYYKCEDFDEEAAGVQLEAGLRADEWLSGGLNDAAANVTYIQDQCGVLQLVTNGADDDSQELTWLGTAININSNPILEFRVQIDAVTANLSGFFVGITETPDIQTINDISAVSDDYFVVGMNSDLATPADLRAWGEDDNGGQVLTQLTGETVGAATWLTIRMDFTDTEQPRVWINHTGGSISGDDEVAAALITQTVQDGIYVYPVIFVQCLDVTPTARTLLVDYVKIWTNRV